MIRFDNWWSRSNPEDHIELSLLRGSDISKGIRFLLKEYVAGIRGEAISEITEIKPPEMLVWNSLSATYSILSFKLSVQKGGAFKIEERNNKCILSHHVWGKLEDTPLNMFIEWFFKNVLKGEKKDFEHTYRELVFIKNEIERNII